MCMAYKSKYTPKNVKKYIGDPTKIVCRSMWERKMCKYLDSNKNIIRWGSEEVVIPYYSPVDRKVRRYFPDFIIKVHENDGSVKKYVVEVKPKRQTVPPVETPKKRKKTLINETLTYAKNVAKWKAAKEWCADHMMNFKIITEYELGL